MDALVTSLTHAWAPGVWGYLALAAAFILGGLVPVPRTPMSIASGFVFGLTAVPVIMVASTMGGIAAFIAARYLIRSRVQALLRRQRHAAAILRAVDVEGWRVVALMRFYGPLPTMVQNYGFGLTGISLSSFTTTTFVFSVPQIVLYCYLGSLGQQAIQGEGWGALPMLTAMAGALCFVCVAGLIGRRVRTMLREADAEESRPDPTA